MALDWKRVNLSHVRDACDQIDSGKAAPKRESRSTFLVLDARRYPAKFVRGLAYELATGIKLASNEFSGGEETIRFFKALGLQTEHHALRPDSGMPRHSRFVGDASEFTFVTPPTPGPVENAALPARVSTTPRAQKEALKLLLTQRFGAVACEAKFPWLRIAARDKMGKGIAKIFDAIADSRGQREFITPGYSLCCDYCIANRKLIIEYDEFQHFTAQRAVALRLYDDNWGLKFNVRKWIASCDRIGATDHDPAYRDEQRAFYDSLRDILAVDNDYTLVRIQHGDYDWTAPNAAEFLNEILPTDTGPVATAQCSMYAEPPARRIAMISHDYNFRNETGLWDYSAQFEEINRICDQQGCDTILYSLYTWDNRSKLARNHATIFSGLKNVQRVILEVGELATSKNLSVETWLRSRPLPLVAKQLMAFSAEAKSRAKDLLKELPSRQIGNSALMICGETNVVSLERATKKMNDPFRFNRALADSEVEVILNPIHDYMRRYEMKHKRCFLSSAGRTVLSVWNKGRKGESLAPPWTVFQNGADKSSEVREIRHSITGRPDIRIGIFCVGEKRRERPLGEVGAKAAADGVMTEEDRQALRDAPTMSFDDLPPAPEEVDNRPSPAESASPDAPVIEYWYEHLNSPSVFAMFTTGYELVWSYSGNNLREIYLAKPWEYLSGPLELPIPDNLDRVLTAYYDNF